MPRDTRLDQIERIVRPESAEGAKMCRSSAVNYIRTIARWDGWPVTRNAERGSYLEAVAKGWPFIMAGRPSAERGSYLAAAAKIREALATIHPVFFLSHKAEANTVEQFAEDLEEAAREIPDRHGGGPDQALIDYQRKVKTAEYARSLLTTFGTTPNRSRRNTQLHLAAVLFKAATGRSLDLSRAVDEDRGVNRQPQATTGSRRH